MKTIHFKAGDLVRLIGNSEKFRYVSKNIIRSVKSGKCYSVSPSRLRPWNVTPLEIIMLAVAIAVTAVSIYFSLNR